MTENPRSETEATNVTAPSEERQEQIRLRAYELYEARGREDGHEIEDWLQAEADVVPNSERNPER
jgi:hypothetical protein